MQNATRLYSSDHSGNYGTVKLEIFASASKIENLESEEIQAQVNKSASEILGKLFEVSIASEREIAAQIKREKKEILDLFSEPIFVEEIPNGYCSSWCCKNKPWFIVTTKVGHIKVGWRKRVIAIDWSKTVGTQEANVLFAAEDVTKECRMIHAWNYEKARQYIAAIIGSADKAQA